MPLPRFPEAPRPFEPTYTEAELLAAIFREREACAAILDALMEKNSFSPPTANALLSAMLQIRSRPYAEG